LIIKEYGSLIEMIPPLPENSIAVVYIARGAAHQWKPPIESFIDSYLKFPAGLAHNLYIVFKGFSNDRELSEADKLFSKVAHQSLHLEDSGFDIGAFAGAAKQTSENWICLLNTYSRLLSRDWLAKLAINLQPPNIGLVGATGSYESLNKWDVGYPKFPNYHIRTNGFMIERTLFTEITENLEINEKKDAMRFESGTEGLSSQVGRQGLELRVVGRNGRGYPPPLWPASETFRLGDQSNLLIQDNQTLDFQDMCWQSKLSAYHRTWGDPVSDACHA